MIILAGGATKTIRSMPTDAVGHLLSPRAWNSLRAITATGRKWAADNDAFSGFDQERYWRLIIAISKADRSNLLWVTLPDVVGNAQETVNLWFEWRLQLDHLGLPAAFVAQDGIESIPDQVPWSEIACLFIGGSTAWKLGPHAEWFATEAKARGLWVHMGRVNTARRIRHAIEIGCDSIDGRSFSAWPDIKQPWAISKIRDLQRQPTLF